MNLYTWVKQLASFICICVLLVQCNTKSSKDSSIIAAVTDSCTISVDAGDFTTSKLDVLIVIDANKNKIVKATKGGWLEYKINVPTAGRYRVQLFAQTTDTLKVNCWIEDYADNTIDRNYNITGNMLLEKAKDNTTFLMVQKEGSPLNTGIHTIRLHFDSGAVAIDKIGFTLLKTHKNSPVVLTQKTSGKVWKLAWSDEFNGKGLPDTSKWKYDIGNWGWGNNELQCYTAGRIENARQEDGNLVIEARKNDIGLPWTSARLTTRGKTSFIYGKIEFRAKVPIARGSWAAGWLLGDDYVDEKSWPISGEVDVLEQVGYENDSITGFGKAHASVHCGAYYFKKNNQRTAITHVKNMQNEFHSYIIEWLPNDIKMFVDDKEYFNYHDTSTLLTWPFNKPQNIILNLAMGGGMGGPKGVDEMLASQKLIFDYVRVYELQ